MKIAIASDHGGFEYKTLLLDHIKQHGYDITDLGAFTDAASDYPDHAAAVAKAIQQAAVVRGILICGSGAGVSVAVNKFKGIRGSVCHDTYSAHQCVEHDDVNVLCIGQRVVDIELAKEITLSFLGAVFSAEERHLRRLNKLLAIEKENMK